MQQFSLAISRLFGLILIAGVSTVGSATIDGNHLHVGEPLPSVTVDGSGGELIMSGESIQYRPWHSDALRGKVRVLYHVAARYGVDKINQAFLDALESAAERQPALHEKVKIVSILNSGDVFPLGGSFARNIFEDNRRIHDHAEFVLDTDSLIQKRWGLSRKNCAVIVIDQGGQVLKFKDGKLSKQEIEQFVTTISERAMGQ